MEIEKWEYYMYVDIGAQRIKFLQVIWSHVWDQPLNQI